MNKSLLWWGLTSLLFLGMAMLFVFKDRWILDNILENNVPVISPDNIPTNAILLDCRSEDEFTISHIPGAMFFPEEAQYPEARISDTIVVYCSLGIRSEKV